MRGHEMSFLKMGHQIRGEEAMRVAPPAAPIPADVARCDYVLYGRKTLVFNRHRDKSDTQARDEWQAIRKMLTELQDKLPEGWELSGVK